MPTGEGAPVPAPLPIRVCTYLPRPTSRAIFGSAPASGAADAQAIRRARADRRLVRKVVYDRDTMLRSLYGPTEAGLALRGVPPQAAQQTKAGAEVGAVRKQILRGGCRMFKVLILVCSMNLAPQDCEMKNAIHVIAGPMVSSELSCRRSAQTLIFRTAVAPTDAEYVKIQCKRLSSTEASADPSTDPPASAPH